MEWFQLFVFHLFLVKMMNDLNFDFSVGHLFLRIFEQFLVLQKLILIVIIRVGRFLFGNMVRDCFYVETILFC